jgi:tetratricopeptide (TPR) repeat protein
VLLLAVGLAVGGGWVWRQAASRRVAAETALVEAEGHRQAGRWTEMRAALERVRGHLAGGGPADLEARLAQVARDADMVANLENVRLRQADSKDLQSEIQSADEGYARAFQGYGVEVDDSDPEEAADRVRGSAVREQLLAALDHWWSVRRQNRDPEGAERVRAAADRADDDGWRTGLRAAIVEGNLSRLKQMVDQAAGRPPAVQALLAGALRAGNAFVEAEGVLRRGLAEHPADFWLAHDLGWVLGDKNRWAEAEGFFRLALGLRPESPGVWLNFGKPLAEQGKLEEAAACFRRATELDPDFVKAHSNLGTLLRQQGKFEAAVPCYRRAIQLDANYAPAHTGLGDALRQLGKLEEAVASSRRGVHLAPKDAEAHHTLGSCLYQQGNLEEAETNYRRAIELNPNHAPAHLNLALLLEKQGKLKEAAVTYRRAIELNPKNVQGHFNLGSVLVQQRKPAEAAACFRRATELDPKFVSAHYNLALALYEQGNLEESAACFRRVIALDPAYVDAHSYLGTVLRRQGKLEEAVACLRRAIEVDPTYAPAHTGLGTALGSQGKLADAEACFRRAIQLDPKDADSHGNLGVALREQGRFREALAALERSYEVGSRSLGWRSPPSDLVRDCRRLIELESRLPAVLAGTDRPADETERLGFIHVCELTRRFAAAARLYAEAFVSQPRLATDPRTAQRYKAACSAARAGCRQEAEATGLTAADRLHWRRQALTWLRADLEEWDRQLGAFATAGPGVAKALRHWQANPGLSGLRDPAGPSRLPAEERAACERLWADVAALLRRAEARK